MPGFDAPLGLVAQLVAEEMQLRQLPRAHANTSAIWQNPVALIILDINTAVGKLQSEMWTFPVERYAFVLDLVVHV